MHKYGKKFLCGLLSASMVLGSAGVVPGIGAVQVFADEEQETGFSWVIQDGTLIISGQGPMEDHEWEDDFPWYGEKGNFSKVVVEEGVTTIGENAFSYYSGITEVTLPSTLETLKECAFFYCTGLTTINMGGNAPVMDSWGQLSGCSSLTTINVPAGATGYDAAPWNSYSVVEAGAAQTPDEPAAPVAPVLSVAGTVLEPASVIEGGYAYTDYLGSVTNGDLYMYTLPAGTTSVDIDFTDNVLAYNYKSNNSTDDDYIYGWYEDYKTGASTGNFFVDYDKDGAPDYIQVQTPYDDAWNSKLLYGIGFEMEEAVSSTYAIDCTSIMRDTGKPSGMYTFENVIVTEQEDGTYLVRMHQASVNRNVIALTDDKEAAKAHTVDWYIGGGDDGYWFTIPVESLDETLYAVMSSESRIAAGNDFSNVIAITFDKDSMTATEEAAATAEDMNINPAVPSEVLTPYTVTANNTGMFKVVDAYMREVNGAKTLYITLNGTGYRSLFKGTYEQAVATGTDDTQWINGVIREDETEFNGKYEFAIPVEDGDSYIQINARSFSKGTWYPRYLSIDQEAATLESGDYAETFALAVTNQNDAEVIFAEMNVTAGPNSNNYLVTATVGLPGYVQAYVGSADEAAAATEGLIDSAVGEFTIQVEKLVAPGSTALDTIMEQQTAVSFKDADGNWAEYTLTFSKANKTLTADYQAPVPAFSVDPAEITVNVGETFELGTVNGDPKPGTYTYFWYAPSDQAVAERVGNAYGVTKTYKAVGAGDATIKVVWDEPYITSECIVHVVDPTPQATAILTQPADFTGNVDQTASFSVEAAGTDLVYQWFYSKNGRKWYPSAAAGADTDTISFKITDANKANTYKCTVTGADEVTVESETAAVVVPAAAVITAQPESVVAKKGQTVTLSLTAENAVAYQWYYSKDGQKWYKSAAEGADTASLTVKAAASNSGNIYRCKVTGQDQGVVTSATASICLAQPAVITAQPTVSEAKAGETASFTVEAEHVTAYQWYYTKDGVKWYASAAAGADTATLTMTANERNMTNQYRCKLTGEDGKVLCTESVGFAE